MAAAPEFVTLQVEDGVGTIRLDRPKMNAIDGTVTAEIRACAEEARDRADVRAVVIYGGERVFAAEGGARWSNLLSTGKSVSTTPDLWRARRTRSGRRW